jgi:hypothetical protein
MLDLRKLAEQNVSLNDLRREGLSEREIFDYRRVKTQVDNQRRQEAQGLDNQIRDLSQFGNVNNFKQQIQQIDPNIRQYMNINENKIEEFQKNTLLELENRINSNKNAIERSIERQKRVNDDSERAREDGLLQENRVYQNAIIRIKNPIDFL